nr:exocyst complex component EXO84C [Ipomoea batatas]
MADQKLRCLLSLYLISTMRFINNCKDSPPWLSHMLQRCCIPDVHFPNEELVKLVALRLAKGLAFLRLADEYFTNASEEDHLSHLQSIDVLLTEHKMEEAIDAEEKSHLARDEKLENALLLPCDAAFLDYSHFTP